MISRPLKSQILTFFILSPLSALAGWSADWAALEAYVDNPTNTVPQYSKTNLLAELSAATLERALAVKVPSDFVNTNFSTVTRFNTRTVLSEIDNTIDDIIVHYLSPSLFDTNGILNVLSPGELEQSNTFYYAWTGCSNTPTQTYLDTTNYPSYSVLDYPVGGSSLPDHSTGGFAEGYPWQTYDEHFDHLGLGAYWRYEKGPYAFREDNTGTNAMWAFIANPATTGNLLAELVYSITNRTTTGGTNFYDCGWITRIYHHLNWLPSTNSSFYSNGWVRAEVFQNSTNLFNTTTAALPSVTFSIDGMYLNTNDWAQTNNQAYSQSGLAMDVSATNSFTLTGAAGAYVDLPPYRALFDLSVTNGLISQTNLSDLTTATNLGDGIRIYWSATTDVYYVNNDAAGAGYAYRLWPFNSRLSSIEAMVQRKRLLDNMIYTLRDIEILSVADGRLEYASGTTNSIANAKSALALVSSNDTSGAEVADVTYAFYTVQQESCAPRLYRAFAEVYPINIAITNVASTNTYTLDLYGREVSHQEVSQWDTELPALFPFGHWSAGEPAIGGPLEHDAPSPFTASQLSGFFRADTITGLSGDTNKTYNAQTLGDLTAPADPANGNSTESDAATDGNAWVGSSRGFAVEIRSAVLKWDFVYD